MNLVGKIIAITNQKGGVGKTTTAVNLSACVAVAGKKTLLVDLDPQGNATSGLGIDKDVLQYTIYDVLINQTEAKDIIVETNIKKLHVLPATITLAGAEVEMVSLVSRETLLKNVLHVLKNVYDYIFIDCPPSLSLLTINALVAADYVVVPVQCEFYALEGLTQLMRTIEAVQAEMNPQLELEGVVMTMFDGRTNLSIQVAEEVKKYFGKKVFKTIIPRNVRLSEAPSYGEPIIIYDPKSKGAEVYKKLAKEVMKNV